LEFRDKKYLQAVNLLVLGGFILAFQDSLVKLISDSTSFWQFQTIRSSYNLILLICISTVGFKISVLIPKNIPAVLFRSSFLIVCMFCFFCAAPSLTFAQMATGLYTYPMFLVVLAVIFLGERLNILRLLSLGFGVVGAVLILKPWDSNFTYLQLFPILSGLFYACNLICVRKFCKEESPLALTATVAICFMISGLLGGQIVDHFLSEKSLTDSLPFIAVGWPEISIFVIGMAALASICNLTGNLCLIKAYQTAESSWLAPLDYLYLIFAIVWGKLLFDQLPDIYALIGMAFITGSGILVAVQALLPLKLFRVGYK